MGYDKAVWDADSAVHFTDAPFAELSLTEKRAAWHLGWDVVDEKLDIWWADTDDGKWRERECVLVLENQS